MKICPTCQAHYEDDRNFCRSDGARLLPGRAFAPDVVARRQLLEARLREEPESPGLLVDLGDLLASVPLYDDALVQYFKALALAPEQEEVRRRIARVHGARGDWEEEAQHLEILLRAHPSDLEILRGLADAYEHGGRKAEAAGILDRWTELAPGDARVWARRRDLLLELRTDEELLAVYRRLSELVSEDLSNWLGLVERLLAEPAPPKAEEWARIAKRLEKAVAPGTALPKREAAAARLCLVIARLRLGVAGPGTMDLLVPADPLALDPAQAGLAAQCLAEIGDLALASGQAEEAAEAYATALAYGAHPAARRSLGEIHSRRADALLRERRFREAIRELDDGLARIPRDPALVALRKLVVHRLRLRISGWVALALGAGVLIVLAVLLF